MEFLDLQIIGGVGKRDVTTPTFKAVLLTLFKPERGKELRTLITGYEGYIHYLDKVIFR